MAKRTPRAPILRKVSALSSKLDISTRSVTSSSTRAPSNPCAVRQFFTFSTNTSPCASSGAETLTANQGFPGSSRCQAPACAMARSSVHSPTARIRPLSSASGTKSSGPSRPSVGCCQRTSASAPTILERPSTTGCQCSSSSPRISAARAEHRVVEAHGAAARVLGVVHGGVGLLEQLGEVAPVARVERDADRGADGERAALDSERPAEDREQPLAERRRLLARLEAVPQQREVVAAQARERVLAPQRVLQSFGHGAQQRVARGVAERVVDQLEAVEIDREQRELRAAARRGEDRLRGALGEQRAVGEPGERIAPRELLDARLVLLARGDVGGGAAVPSPAALGI